MKKSRPIPSEEPRAGRDSGRAATSRRKGGEQQPAATGADGGSPAAPVMKQFAKTKAESSGRT